MIPLMLLCAGYITEDRAVGGGKHHFLSEHEYFARDAVKLRDVACPNCASTNALFSGFNSVGCRECLQYFGAEDFNIIQW